MMLRLPAAAVTCTLAACASLAAPESDAVLVTPDADGRAELQQVVSAALNVATVTLADDALTRESLLVIQPAPARDARGQRLSGRDFGRPEQFRLLARGTRCTLVHERTGMRYELRQSRCATATR